VIENILFKQAFTTFWQHWKTDINSFKDKLKWWEITKCKIRELCIDISKEHQHLVLKNEEILHTPTQLLCNEKAVTIYNTCVFIDNTEVPLKKLKTRDMYLQNLYPVAKPNCTIAWKEIFQKDYEWKQIFNTANASFQTPKVKEFHWKCIHRAVYTECRLKKMKKSNGLCKICHVNEETTCHMLFECHSIRKYWNYLSEICSEILNITYNFDVQQVLFNNKESINETTNNVLNFVTLESKWQIWKNRSNVKYGNKVHKNNNDILNTVIKQCTQKLEIFKNIEKFLHKA